MYSKKVMKHFLHPKFHKKIRKFNGVGQVGNIKCGDIMKVYINVEKNIIKDICFETLGCVAAIASSDAMCELVKGKRHVDLNDKLWNSVLEATGQPSLREGEV